MVKSKIHKICEVKLDSNQYDITIGNNLLPELLLDKLNSHTKNSKVMFIFDSYLGPKAGKLERTLWRAGYEAHLYRMESGKHNKTIERVIDIYRVLEANNFSRDSTIVALGGGVVGDLAGFAASTYLRGMNLVHIPTTLMAMIDSSIGGKVAVNFKKTINAIGNYYHPIFNITDLDFLASLSDRDFSSGLAEIIKCAIISDKKLFEYMDSKSESILARRKDSLFHVMTRAIEIKIDHVSGDIREQGRRLELNYGHTIGHAIEVSTDVNTNKEVFRHGEGVALGMVGAAFLAEKHLPPGNGMLRKHESILPKYGLPTRVSALKCGWKRDKLIEECMKNIHKDKKRKDGRIRFVLADKIGHCGVSSDVPELLIFEAFNYLIEK